MPNDGNHPTQMVLVMGVTGAGQIYFIDKLKEGAVEEGEGLQSRMPLASILRASYPVRN